MTAIGRLEKKGMRKESQRKLLYSDWDRYLIILPMTRMSSGSGILRPRRSFTELCGISRPVKNFASVMVDCGSLTRI